MNIVRHFLFYINLEGDGFIMNGITFHSFVSNINILPSTSYKLIHFCRTEATIGGECWEAGNCSTCSILKSFLSSWNIWLFIYLYFFCSWTNCELNKGTKSFNRWCQSDSCSHLYCSHWKTSCRGFLGRWSWWNGIHFNVISKWNSHSAEQIQACSYPLC